MRWAEERCLLPENSTFLALEAIALFLISLKANRLRPGTLASCDVTFPPDDL